MTHPQIPYGPNYESKNEDNRRRKNRGALHDSQRFGGRATCWSSRMGLGKWQAINHSHGLAQNQTISSLVHNLNTFGAWTNDEQTQTHKTHHGLDLGEATTFPLIVYFVPDHGTNIQMSFCPRTPKFSNLGLPQLWAPITLCADLRLRWGRKQSYSPRQELSNNMCHTTITQINQGNSRLLVVINQIDDLIPSRSFGHNLSFN
jgi:hypothetical protein